MIIKLSLHNELSLHNAIIKFPLILYRIDLSIKFLDLIIQFGIYTSENISKV